MTRLPASCKSNFWPPSRSGNSGYSRPRIPQMPRNRAAEETSFRKRGNDVKRTFQKGAALALAALWFPVAFLALAETPKEALDRLKEEKNRLEEQIEQA